MRRFFAELFAPIFRVGTETGPTISTGAGSPETVVTAPVGSLYLRTDGGTGTTEYRKETGVGNTGWVAASGGGSAIAVQDEGANITTALGTLNFVGGGVTVTGGATSVVTIPAAPASIVAGRIYRNTNQSIPTGAGYTSLSWSTVGYETGGDFWTSGATITIPETGLYQITTEATFDGTGLIAMTTCNMQILVNGATVIGEDEVQVAVGAKGSLFVFAQRNFTAGDTILTQVKHSDAGSVNVLAQGDHSPDIIFAKVGGAVGASSPFNYGRTLVMAAGAFNL